MRLKMDRYSACLMLMERLGNDIIVEIEEDLLNVNGNKREYLEKVQQINEKLELKKLIEEQGFKKIRDSIKKIKEEDVYNKTLEKE